MMLEEILRFNDDFVQAKNYTAFQTTKYPDKKIVILTCMDTRLTELLPKSMGLKNGDAKIIKNAGAVVSHPFGSIMRSIIVAVYELKAEEIYVVGHHDCGMANLDYQKILAAMKKRGISKENIETLERAGINLGDWLKGFDSVEESIKSTVKMIKQHPLLADDIIVHGLIMDPETGKLDLVSDSTHE